MTAPASRRSTATAATRRNGSAVAPCGVRSHPAATRPRLSPVERPRSDPCGRRSCGRCGRRRGRRRGPCPTTASTGSAGRRSTGRAAPSTTPPRAAACRARRRSAGRSRRSPGGSRCTRSRSPRPARARRRAAAAVVGRRRRAADALHAQRGADRGPDADERAAGVEDFGRSLRPSGVRMVSTRWNTNRSTSRTQQQPARRTPPIRNGSCPTSRPDIQTRCRRRQLLGDLGAGVAGADHQHRPVRELRRVPVVAASAAGRSPRAARRRTRARCGSGSWPSRPRPGRPRAVAVHRRGRHVAVARRDSRSTRDAAAHRQLEALGVGLEVVGHLVLGREVAGRRRERHAGAAR